jgi:hypothetical protein
MSAEATYRRDNDLQGLLDRHKWKIRFLAIELFLVVIAVGIAFTAPDASPGDAGAVMQVVAALIAVYIIFSAVGGVVLYLLHRLMKRYEK